MIICHRCFEIGPTAGMIVVEVEVAVAVAASASTLTFGLCSTAAVPAELFFVPVTNSILRKAKQK